MADEPNLRLFLFSPSAMAIDFAAKAMPEVRPETKLEDPAPLMSAAVSPLLPPLETANAGSRLVLGFGGFAALAGAVAGVLQLRPRPTRSSNRRRLLAGQGDS
jgi:hypothetical protein